MTREAQLFYALQDQHARARARTRTHGIGSIFWLLLLLGYPCYYRFNHETWSPWAVVVMVIWGAMLVRSAWLTSKYAGAAQEIADTYEGYLFDLGDRLGVLHFGK